MNQSPTTYRILTVGSFDKTPDLITQLGRTGHMVTAIDSWSQLGDPGENTCDLILVDRIEHLRRPNNVKVDDLLRLGAAAMVMDDSPASADCSVTANIEWLTPSASPAEREFRIARAISTARTARQARQLRQQVAFLYGYDNLVGDSESMLKLKETLRRVAATDIAVFLTGPTGTGKQLTARLLHNHSARRNGPFVTLDCGTVPSELVERELFGSADSMGCLAEADGGTLFLRDVEQLPEIIHSRLAAFFRDFLLRRSDGTVVRKTDLRLISASNKDMAAQVKSGTFSEELFYQLSVLPIRFPALADRPDDILPLVEYFLQRYCITSERPSCTLSRSALEKLLEHNWPGNVRELENSVKRALALCDSTTITAEHIIFVTSRQPATGEPVSEREVRSLDEGQRTLIIKALSNNNWNFTQTASELGIGRTTLWRKVKRYNLRRDWSTENVR